MKFDGCRENFEDWKWEFQHTCERLGQGKVLDDKTKGLVLEMALPENLLKEFRLLQKTQSISFNGFMAKLEDRFGQGQPMIARKKLEKVELPGTGKIKTDDLKAFEIQFVDALKNIKDMGLEEARRSLLCKLPDWIRIWIVEEENQRTNTYPIVEFRCVPGMSDLQVSETIHSFIGEMPVAVQNQAPGQVLVKFQNLETARRLIALQGRIFRGTNVSLTAKIREVKMNIPEIFTFIFDRLQVREMGTECYSNKDFYHHHHRYQRSAEKAGSSPPQHHE